MLYQLFCLARPMANGELGSLIQGIGRVVYSTGGVVCDVKSYGRQFLAYKIKGVHGKYDQVCVSISGCGGRGRGRRHVRGGRGGRMRAAAIWEPRSAPSRAAAAAAACVFFCALFCLAPITSPLTPTLSMYTLSPSVTTQANIWELEFAASPDALRQVHHELRVNEGVLRFAVLRREALPRVRIPRRRPALPSSAPIALDWRPEVGGGAADAAADATAAALLASEAELRGLRELIAAGAPAPLDAAASSRPAP